MALTAKMYALGRMQRKTSNGVHEALESGFPLGVAVCVPVAGLSACRSLHGYESVYVGRRVQGVGRVGFQ